MTKDKELIQEKQKTEKMNQINQQLIFCIKIIESSATLKESNKKMVDLKWDKKRREAYGKYSNAKDNNLSKNKIDKLYENYTEILKQQESEIKELNKMIDKAWEGCNNSIVQLYNKMNSLGSKQI